MEKEYPFLVEMGNEGGSNRKYEQRLFCRCGHKQKVKAGIKRILLRNAESVYEDKYDVESIRCERCGEDFSVLNNLLGIKQGHNILAEISFESENLEVRGKVISSLKRNRKYFHYVESDDSLANFVVTDIISFDSANRQVSIFTDSTDMKNGGFSGNLLTSSSANPVLGQTNTTKNSKMEVFDLSKPKLLDSFFSYDGSVTYLNLEVAFDYIDRLISDGYDYDSLYTEKFLSDFRVSKHVIEEEVNGKTFKYVMKKDMFGSGSLLKKKLDAGDYVNRLQKFSEICFVFTSFPSISTLYKLKGLGFIHDAYKGGYLAPQNVLDYQRATNSMKIIEVCCRHHFRNPDAHQNIFLDKVAKSERQEGLPDDEFRISPLMFKAIREPEDAMVIYRFHKKALLSKTEMESLFQRFDSEDVILVMSRLVSGTNMRNVKLDMRHLNHILKNRLFEDQAHDWLGIYYDTINSLKLIVDIINARKEQGKSISGLGKLMRISDEKLFEIKNYQKLKILHDEMTAVYRAMEDEGKDLKYRSVVKQYSTMNSKVNMFDFKVIPNLNELSKEGLVMHHCIYTYLNDIASGNYLAVRVKDLISKERATMGLKVEGGKPHLQQLKGYYNSRPTALLIETVLAYCESMGIDIQSQYLHTSDIQPNPSLEKRMREYLEPVEASKLRMKAKSKN
jgi:hypothetical protein